MNTFKTVALPLLTIVGILAASVDTHCVAAPPAVRIINGFGKKITVTAQADGQIELLDENIRSRYATDAVIPGKKLTKLANGDLSYRSERGDAVTIHADDRRTTSIEKLQITINESVGSDGHPFTTEFTIGQGVKLNGMPMSGRWVRAEHAGDSFRLVVAGTGQPHTLLGKLELTDLYSGEVRFTDAAAHFRGTYRRDGYIRREHLDPQNAKAIRAIESFPEGHELDRTVLSASAIEALKKEGCEVKADQHVERVLLIDALGNITYDLVEVLRDGKANMVRLEDPAGVVWIRATEKYYGDKWICRRPGVKEPEETFGEMDRIGADTIRQIYPGDHRTIHFRADGSWIHELSGERIRLTPELKLDRVEGPAYVIRGDAQGIIDVTNGDGDRFSVDSPLESNRLTIDPKTGDLTLVERHGYKITVHPGGNRTEVYDKRRGLSAKLDKGGRMYRTYNAAGEYFNQRGYTRGETDQYYLSAFEDNERAVWKNTRLPNGQQKWDLISGANGVTVSLDVNSMTMTRQNSIAMTFSDRREVRSISGTYIGQTQVTKPNGDQESEVKVGVGSLEKPAYRLLTTHNRQGQLVRQELNSKSGRFVRGGDGVDIKKSPFRQVDDKGQQVPGTTPWLGYIAIDEEGTLIKYSFAPTDGVDGPSNSDGEAGNKAPDARNRANTRPFVPNTYYLFTSGDSEQHFENGAVIYREFGGDIWKIRTITGETIRIHYEERPEADGKKVKRIAAIVENGVIWKYEPQHGKFVSKGRLLNNLLGEAFINLNLNATDGELTRRILGRDGPKDERVLAYVDGGMRFEGSRGKVVESNGQGSLTKLVDGRENQFEVESGADGHPVRIDMATEVSVVDKDYVASSTKPLNKKEVRGTKLSLRGFGAEKYISYTNAAGHEVNLWTDDNSEEYDASPGNKVIAVTTRVGIVRPGEPAKLLLDYFKDVVTEIEPWRGEGDDRHFIYRDKAGHQLQHYSSGAMLIYDGQHRLIRTRDFSGRIWELTYAAEADRLPIKIASSVIELKRDPRLERWRGHFARR